MHDACLFHLLISFDVRTKVCPKGKRRGLQSAIVLHHCNRMLVYILRVTTSSDATNMIRQLLLLLLPSPLILLLISSQRGFDPPLHGIGFLILLLDGRISDDELRSNEVLGNVTDEACDGEY
jgi:hypothetical protein